jgi:hypothetical protein
MSDTFAYWRNALVGSFGAIHENDPQPGYYRTKAGRDGRALPVAIWRETDGRVSAIRDGLPVDPSTIWTWCCLNPVTYETYVAVAERGEAWPEDVPSIDGGRAGANTGKAGSKVEDAACPGPARDMAVGAGGRQGVAAAAVSSLPSNSSLPSVSPPPGVLPGPGHNSKGAIVGRAMELKATIDGLWLQASDWLGAIGSVSSQVEADRAANFAERFGELEKTAEEERTSEKKPVLEQGRAIDATWKPVIGAAEEAKRAMKKALEPFLIAETQKLKEEAGFGGVMDAARAGTNGRRVALRRTRRVHVSDRNAFIAHYRRDGRLYADEAVQKVLLKLAEADLAAGRAVPGAQIVEEQVAA